MSVSIHPEVHRVISHQCVDSGESIRERIHNLLSAAIGRSDLIDRRSAASV